MTWPYHFLELTAAEKYDRRLSLNKHAAYAQLSALLPLVLVLIVRCARWLAARIAARRGTYDAVPNSPAAKHQRKSSPAWWLAAGRRLSWWLGDDIVVLGQNFGRRDQLVFGTAWALWLLFLSLQGTGEDYAHLSKRFGAIAVSQFPIQYLLANKYINPVAYVFGSSHEELNRWHRVMGWIIFLFMCLHGACYFNYYVQLGVVFERMKSSRTAPLGIAALSCATLMTTTAISIVRRFSYRIFFITHLFVAFAMPPIIFFHVHHARLYMIEALVVFVLDLIVRNIYKVTAQASVELIPGTNLIKIVAKVPPSFASDFQDYPASHAYVNVPMKSRPGLSPVYDLTFNPFTVASVNEEAGELMLVARQLKGPVSRALVGLANRKPPGARFPLKLEGPYGINRHFPAFVGGEFDRVLLVAGGVGSTFIVPIYQSIISENPGARVDLVWAVREAGEATWPASVSEKGALNDERIQLYLTGSSYDANGGEASSSGLSRDVEMDQMHKDRKRNKYTPKHSLKRPDLRKIVDDVFRRGQEERIAILVCGPEAMARELRGYVGDWVKKGREVWWHNENFSW